jgi:repressor LexA
MALTRRQREIYEFIRCFVAENGYSPSLEEIGAHFGLSSRSIEPVEPPASGLVSLRLLGTVAAGMPIEAVEVAETIDVPRELVAKRGESFVLRVAGDSMIEDQICDGDFVIVESRAEVRDGETVVALLRGTDATLKKLYRAGRAVRLEPANAKLEPIEVPAEDVQVRGVVRGLIRRY